MITFTTFLIHYGMDGTVHPTVNVVHNWECSGPTEQHLCQWHSQVELVGAQLNCRLFNRVFECFIRVYRFLSHAITPGIPNFLKGGLYMSWMGMYPTRPTLGNTTGLLVKILKYRCADDNENTATEEMEFMSSK